MASFHQVAETPCSLGSFCMGGVMTPCPPGRYGGAPGLHSSLCSGPCTPGYYCPLNSTLATQVRCGDVSVYCPLGSALPTQALPGEYTVGRGGVDVMETTAPCPSGSFCVNGFSALCPAGRFGCADRLGDPDCNGPCTGGFYCPAGSTSSQAYVQSGGLACCVMMCVCCHVSLS